jgi:hypothetical protein
VTVEVATRKAKSRQARHDDLAASLAFAREHLGMPMLPAAPAAAR